MDIKQDRANHARQVVEFIVGPYDNIEVHKTKKDSIFLVIDGRFGTKADFLPLKTRKELIKLADKELRKGQLQMQL